MATRHGTGGVVPQPPSVHSPVRTPLWALLCFAVTGGLIYGYNVSAVSYLKPVAEQFTLDTTQVEVVSGGASFGAMLTMPLSGYLADRYGRRATVLLGCVPAVAGPVLLGLSATGLQAVLCRVLLGVGNAVAIHVVPIYLTEVALPAHRALLVALFQFSVSVGLTLQPLLQLATGNWRVVAAVGAVPGAMSALLAACVLRRSRAWSRVAEERALARERRVRGRQRRSSSGAGHGVGPGHGLGSARGSTVQAAGATTVAAAGAVAAGEDAGVPPKRLEKVSLLGSALPLGNSHAGAGPSRGGAHGSAAVDGTRKGRGSERRTSFSIGAGEAPASRRGCATACRAPLRCCASWLRPLSLQPNAGLLVAIGVVLAWTNNSTDIFLFYGVQVLEDAGFATHSSLQLLAVLSAWTAVMVFPAMALLGRVARRPLFLASFGIVVLSFAGQALAFASFMPPEASRDMVLGWMLVFVLAFQCGPGSMFLVLLSEINAVQSRGVAVSIATFSMSAFSVLLNGTLLSTVEAFGSCATFAGYGVVYAACWLFLWRHLPETQHRNMSSTEGAVEKTRRGSQGSGHDDVGDDGSESARAPDAGVHSAIPNGQHHDGSRGITLAARIAAAVGGGNSRVEQAGFVRIASREPLAELASTNSPESAKGGHAV